MRRAQAGQGLAEAIVALALVTLVVLGGVGLVQLALRTAAEAEHLDRAREAADAALARAGLVSWHRLPELLGAEDDDSSALADSWSGTTPPGWDELLDVLPEPRLVLRLEGVGADGAAAPFEVALALRVTAIVSYQGGPGRRAVTLGETRF